MGAMPGGEGGMPPGEGAVPGIVIPPLCIAGPPPPSPGGASVPPPCCGWAVAAVGGTGSLVLMLWNRGGSIEGALILAAEGAALYCQ